MSALLILISGILLGVLIFYIILRLRYPSSLKAALTYNESDAEAVLKKAGLTILSKQTSRPIITFIDGKSHLGAEYADYTVQKENKKFAVKVVDAAGSDPTEKSLRRKLFELKHLFPGHGILLLDLASGELHEIKFELPKTEKEIFLFVLIAMVIIAMILMIVLLLSGIRLY